MEQIAVSTLTATMIHQQASHADMDRIAESALPTLSAQTQDLSTLIGAGHAQCKHVSQVVHAKPLRVAVGLPRWLGVFPSDGTMPPVKVCGVYGIHFLISLHREPQILVTPNCVRW